MAIGERQQGSHLRLEVSGYARVGLSNEAGGLDVAGVCDEEGLIVARSVSMICRGGFELCARFFQPLDECVQPGCRRMPDQHVATCDGGSNCEGGGFDTVRGDSVLNWIEYGDAVDFDGSWLRKVNASTGTGEECGEFDNFWFLSCIEDASGAFGKCGCSEDVAGAGYGWTSGAREVDVGTAELWGGSMDKAI